MEDAQKSHQEIDCGRHQKSCGHETPYVAVVGDKAVHELAHGIDEQEGRPDDAELSRREHLTVYKGLLDHAEAQSAHIIQAVCDRSSPESPDPQPAICGVDHLLRNLRLGRPAYPVEVI